MHVNNDMLCETDSSIMAKPDTMEC